MPHAVASWPGLTDAGRELLAGRLRLLARHLKRGGGDGMAAHLRIAAGRLARGQPLSRVEESLISPQHIDRLEAALFGRRP